MSTTVLERLKLSLFFIKSTLLLPTRSRRIQGREHCRKLHNATQVISLMVPEKPGRKGPMRAEDMQNPPRARTSIVTGWVIGTCDSES